MSAFEPRTLAHDQGKHSLKVHSPLLFLRLYNNFTSIITVGLQKRDLSFVLSKLYRPQGIPDEGFYRTTMDGNGRDAKLKRLPHHSSGVEQGRRMSSSDSRHTERARALDTERHPTTSFLISTT